MYLPTSTKQATMKILLLAALIELHDDGDTESETAPVPTPPKPFSQDELIRRLLREVREGRNPNIWKEEPRGPIFKS